MKEAVWDMARQSWGRSIAAAKPFARLMSTLEEQTATSPHPLSPLERVFRSIVAIALDRLHVPDAADIHQLAELVSRIEQRLKALQAKSARDVAELQQALAASERALADAAAEYQRNAALAMLATAVPSIAHDLTTPIANASLVAESLQQSLLDFRGAFDSGSLRKSDLTAFITRAEEAVGILCSTTRRAGILAGSLKQLSVDSVSGRHRDFELAELVKDVLLTVTPSLRGKPMRIETDIPDQLRMSSYPGAIGQILINLVQNAAIHAFSADHPGTLRVSAELQGDDRLRIQVADDGRGMRPAVLEQIFTPFFTTRAAQGGSGLGLSHSRHLTTEVLKGQMTVRSTPGAGTCFTLDVPRFLPDDTPS